MRRAVGAGSALQFILVRNQPFGFVALVFSLPLITSPAEPTHNINIIYIHHARTRSGAAFSFRVFRACVVSGGEKRIDIHTPTQLSPPSGPIGPVTSGGGANTHTHTTAES